MSIASDVKTYILTNATSITKMTEDNFGATNPALMVRSDPSTANEVEFIDGSYEGRQQLTFYARDSNPANAQAVLNLIRSTIDKKEIALTGLQVLKVQSVSTVSYVSKEDTGEFIYSTTADVTFYGKNPY